jgi:hypothetical protein
MHETRCPKGNEFLTWSSGLPHKISDRDVDSEGYYSYDQVIKLDYPTDFDGISKITERSAS